MRRLTNNALLGVMDFFFPEKYLFRFSVKVTLESYLGKTNFEIQMHLSGSATNRKTVSGGRDEEAWHPLSSDGARIIERTPLMTEIQFLISFKLALTPIFSSSCF